MLSRSAALVTKYIMSSVEVDISTRHTSGRLMFTVVAAPSNFSRATNLRSGHSRTRCQILKVVEAIVVVSFIDMNSRLHFIVIKWISVEQVCACCHVVFPLCIPPAIGFYRDILAHFKNT